MTLFPFLQSEFNLTRTQVGLYSTFLYFSSTGVTIFSGRIADYWEVKKSMLWGLALMGLFIFMHSLAPNFETIIIFAFLTGLGFSIILPTSSKGIAEWFSIKQRSTAMGIMTLGYPVGGIISAVVLPWVGKAFGWRTDIILMALLFFTTAVIFKLSYSDKIKIKVNKKMNIEKKNSLFKDIILFLKNKYLLVLCFLGIMFGFASGIVVTHLTLFLYIDYGLSEIIAGLGFMSLQVGSMVGRPLWGFVNDKIFKDIKRTGFLLIGIIISFVSILFYLLSNFKPVLIIILILTFLLGLSARGWQGLYFSAVSEQVGEKDTGLGIGLSLVFVRIGLLSGPPLFGLIADFNNSYTKSWLLLGIIIFISIIISYYFLFKFNHKTANLTYD
jgi:MFS family permease